MSRARSRTRRAFLSLTVFLVFLTAFPRQFQAAESGMIPWRTDFEQAQALARQWGRPLLVQFHAPWCQYCRQMEATTFVSEPVIRLARDRFVSVAVQSDQRLDLVGRFGVSGLPATLVLAPDGQLLLRHEGYIDPSTFAAWLQRSADRVPIASSPPAESPALGGNCPVTFVQRGSLQPGSPGVTARYDGRLYRFLDAEARAAFLNDPERYLPSNGGLCVVHQVDGAEVHPGDPRFGVYYKRRLYLCADESSRQRFAADPERYAGADLADSGFCPHCRTIAGQRVQGDARFPLTLDGRRYLFPDSVHREAFRSAPDRYLR